MNEVAELQPFLDEQPDVQRLRRVLQLADGFELEIVVCPTPIYAKALTELMVRDLTAAQRPSRHLVVRPAAPGRPIDQEDITRDLLDPLLAASAPRVWIFDLSLAQPHERGTWRWLFHRFNERRNGLAVRLASPVVLLLPRWLEPMLPAEAPDLWSARSLTIELTAKPFAQVVIKPYYWRRPSFENELSALQAHAAMRRENANESLEERRAYTAALRRFILSAFHQLPIAEVRKYVEDELVPLSETIDDPIEHARALRALAAVRWREKKLDDALAILRGQVLPLLHHSAAGRPPSAALTIEIAEASQEVALVLQSQGRWDEALTVLEQEVLPVQERTGDVSGQAITLDHIADTYLSRGEVDKALGLLRDRLVPLYERAADSVGRARALSRVGQVHQIRGELDSAKQAYSEALAMYNAFDDKPAAIRARNALATIAEARGDLDEAVQIRRDEILPLLELAGGIDLYDQLFRLGGLLRQRGTAQDQLEAQHYLDRAVAVARSSSVQTFSASAAGER